MSGFSIYQAKNYMRRHSSTGSATVAAPATLVGGLYRTTYTVTHSLGYVPQVRVYFENSASDGKIYPAAGSRVSTVYPGLTLADCYCLWEVTSTTLTIYLEAFSSKVGNRVIYWVVYEDAP